MQLNRPGYFHKTTLLLLSIFIFSIGAAAQSGGQFAIAQSVIAGGGGTSSGGGQFSLSGTTGQTVAGQNATNPQFSDHAGFWNPTQLAPTAAMVSVSGRVITADGNGIKNVRISLVGSNGAVKSTQTSSLGYFRFEDVEVGQMYILEMASKRYVFANPTRVLNVQDEITDMDFIAEPQ